MEKLLNNIKEILERNPLLRIDTDESIIKKDEVKISIQDNRFDIIEKEIKEYIEKDNNFYSELIKLLAKELNDLYDKKISKKDTRLINNNNETIKIVDINGIPVELDYSYKIKDSNTTLSESLFNYICDILEKNKDIELDIETLKILLNRNPKLFELIAEENYLFRTFNFEWLANILECNNTLKKSKIKTEDTYQLLIDTYQINNYEIFPKLITTEQFKESHTKLDEFLKNCNARTFVEITDIIVRKIDGNFDRFSYIKNKKENNYIEQVIVNLLKFNLTKKDVNFIHNILTDKNIDINYEYKYYDYTGENSLLSDLAFRKNKIILQDLLNKKENVKQCYWSGDYRIELYKLYATIGEYDKALENFNENYKVEYDFYEDYNDDLNRDNYTYGEYTYIDTLGSFIKSICNSFKDKDIEYSKKIEIIKSILNNENVKYINLNEILPSLKETLFKEDYALLIEALLEREKNNNIKFITTKDNKSTYARYKIEIISSEQAFEIINNLDTKKKKLS